MNIIELLSEFFSITDDELKRAASYQEKYGDKVENILINMGSLSEEQLPYLYSKYFELPLYEPLKNVEEREFSSKLNIDDLLLNDWVPISAQDNNWTFVCTYPLNLKVNEWLSSHDITAKIFIASATDIQMLQSKMQNNEDINVDFDNYDTEEEKLKELATEAPIVNLLNNLITKGLRLGASDMHLEPFMGRYRVRFRVDGVLSEADRLAPQKQLPLITRVKILSGMDIAEKRRPQDGKIEMRIANQEIDIRVSALPLNDGESMVMRFLKKENIQYEMSVLGLSPDVEQSILKDIKTTAGVVLLTGPTGSGKTTTLYTFLNSLNSDDVKIITLEDPVEYQLAGINQVQVNSDIGFDFAAGLRSIVRQDPDIIMLGEIRDKETAQIALQSALTGHLVFSTVHTNDAASAYTRLLDLGVEEFLLNAALISIVAQRLARKVCLHCMIKDPNSETLFKKYNLLQLQQRFALPEINLVKGKGCEHCNDTGYKGRVAITEYLACDDEIKAIPKNETFVMSAKKHNHNLNRRNLLEDGLYKAMQGLITIDEAIRVAG